MCALLLLAGAALWLAGMTFLIALCKAGRSDDD
jgi:hypothetical protein